jgi:hypothetical protein
MMMARIEKIMIKEANFGFPPIFVDSVLCSGYIASARIRLHRMMLTKGTMIIRHQPTIRKIMNSRMVVS